MGMMLNLADVLLARGRKFQSLGRDHDALQILNRLCSFRQLPPAISEETQARLTEIQLRCGRFTRARRHATALLAQCPDNARYHYLMASALNGDERSDPQRAAEHYRRSLALDPNQTRCLGEFGRLALRLGETEEGLQCLRQAVTLTPDDPEVVGRLVEGLREEGLIDEARDALRAARFRNPRDGRFQKLWNDFHFRLLRTEQEAARLGEAIPVAQGNGPRLLPFVPLKSTATRPSVAGTVVRLDAASATQPPHSPQPSRLPGKKHA